MSLFLPEIGKIACVSFFLIFGGGLIGNYFDLLIDCELFLRRLLLRKYIYIRVCVCVCVCVYVYALTKTSSSSSSSIDFII